MSVIGLIDGDIYAYEAAAAAEVATDWGDGLWTLHAWEGPARQKLDDRLNELADSIGADRLIVALSDSENWRKDVLPTYKSNRNGVRRPMLLSVLKQHISDNYETFVRPTLEADDVLGILSTWGGLKGTKIIVTKDKDLQTIPGLHYLTHRTELGVFEVSEHQANFTHFMQTLTGDTTDGYSGCPGVGPKTAEKLLMPFADETKHGDYFDVESAWKVIVASFNKKGLSEEEAITQARIARICRASDYDFKRKQVKLWTPPREN